MVRQGAFDLKHLGWPITFRLCSGEGAGRVFGRNQLRATLGNMVMVRGRAISETATDSVTVLAESKRKSELQHDLHCTVAYFT